MMSKFNVGDKARVVRGNGHCFKVGCVVTIVKEDLGDRLQTYLSENEEGLTQWVYNHDLEPITETPKEITLNGATYVLKEEPKPVHEWKFGDIAKHTDYGVGIVVGIFEKLEFHYNNGESKDAVERIDLTFLRRADLSV